MYLCNHGASKYLLSSSPALIGSPGNLIAKDTIEERIMQMQESKRDLVNSVLGGDGISSALFTREDVLALLGGDGR